MQLVVLKELLSVYQVTSFQEIDFSSVPLFIGQTDDELSVVSPTSQVPKQTVQREDDWRGIKVVGPLDFSLVGILAKIATLLADVGISIFAVSTFDTDYILVKADTLDSACAELAKQGYEISVEGLN